MMRAFEFATNEAWAIRAHYSEDGRVEAPELELILQIAQRAHEPDYDRVLKAQAHHMEARQAASVPVDGIAQVNVIGPIFRYSNLFTQISGATSVSAIQSDLVKAGDDGMVRGILMNYDSPGGQVDGISDLADTIRELAKRKPIHAYSDGAVASGALWLASAASRITISDTALAGSVGVVANLSQSDKKPGQYEFVSSISPKKRADAGTDQGRAQIQAHVDQVAQVFVEKLARYRGVSVAKILSDFGQGDVLVGSAAVVAGMVDQIGTRDSALAAMRPKPQRTYSLGALSAANNPKQKRSNGMDVEFSAEQLAAIKMQVDTARAEACAAERTRISSILMLPEAEGRENLARTVALTTDLPPDVAARLIGAAPKTAAVTAIDTRNIVNSEFVQQMAMVKNAEVGVSVEKTQQQEIDEEVEQINMAGRR